MSVANVSIVASSLSSAALTMTERGLASSDDSAPLAVAGVNLLLSGGSQLKEYYDRHTRIQELQHRFIREICAANIARCYSPGRNNNIIEMQGSITPEGVINFLKQHTYATIVLTIQNISFTLRNNGLCSLMFGGATLASVSATAVATGLFVSNFLAKQAIEAATEAPTTMASTMITSTTNEMTTDEIYFAVSLGVSAIPFTKLWSTLVDFCYKQELNLLRSIRLVIGVLYENNNMLDKLPLTFLGLFTGYISPECMNRNIQNINLCREEKRDLEMGEMKAEITSLQKKLGL